MSVFKLTAYNTPDVGVAGATLNALANGAWAYGSEIDNSTALYELGDLAITLSSAVTAAANGSIDVYLLPNVDGNYTATAGNPGTYYAGGVAVPAGSVTSVQITGIRLAQKFKIVIQNNLGVALPATSTSTCSLYRYSGQTV